MQKISVNNATAILEWGIWKSTDTKLQNMLNGLMSFEEKTDKRLEKGTAKRMAKIFDGYYFEKETTSSTPLENTQENNNAPISKQTSPCCKCSCRKQTTDNCKPN